MSSTEWYQQALTAPQVIEVTLKIGLIPSADHAQAWMELKDPTTGVLIGQSSQPAIRIADVRAALAAWAVKTADAIEDVCGPF